MSTIAILATEVTASLRATQPRPTKGTNQTEVPTKNTAKKSRAAATLPNSAALTPAATNGGQRLKPVRKPSAAAPGTPRFLVTPMLTSSEPEHDWAQVCPAEYAYQSSTQASNTWITPIRTMRGVGGSDTRAPSSQATAANRRYPRKRAPRKIER